MSRSSPHAVITASYRSGLNSDPSRMLSLIVPVKHQDSCGAYEVLPDNFISPELVSVSFRIEFRRHVFPDPTVPITTTSSPGLTVKLIRFKLSLLMYFVHFPEYSWNENTSFRQLDRFCAFGSLLEQKYLLSACASH